MNAYKYIYSLEGLQKFDMRAECLRVLVGNPLVVVGHVLRGSVPVPDTRERQVCEREDIERENVWEGGKVIDNKILSDFPLILCVCEW